MSRHKLDKQGKIMTKKDLIKEKERLGAQIEELIKQRNNVLRKLTEFNTSTYALLATAKSKVKDYVDLCINTNVCPVCGSDLEEGKISTLSLKSCVSCGYVNERNLA